MENEILDQGLARVLPAGESPRYLNQVHGANVVNAGKIENRVDADAAWSRENNIVCVVRTADCLPILLADKSGAVVCAVHGGWRGLLAGVIGNAVNSIKEFQTDSLCAWIGPGIGAKVYEVGGELRDAFLARDAAYEMAFRRHGEKWLCNLVAIARHDLVSAGVTEITGGNWCSYSDPERFHSFRRDAGDGRMLSMIWMEAATDVRQ